MNTPRRQPGDEIVRVELRLDPDDHRRVKAAADNQDRSMHSLLIHIVKQWLREHPEGEKSLWVLSTAGQARRTPGHRLP